MLVNIHFYHIWKPQWKISIFNKMAATQSPCGGVKPRVLHFKVKNTPWRDKKWKEKVQKNAQFSFCGGREAFHQEIVHRGIQYCFLYGGAHGLFWNATKAKKITFLKGNLCILKFFIDVLYIFLFSAKEKLQFEMDFVLNLPCAKPIVYLGVGSTIKIVLCELV